MTGLPLRYEGDGEFTSPPGFRKIADRIYVVGQTYRMEPIEERSDISHRHEFAWLREAWANLPEKLADQYATPEHLRKAALIEAGYYTETIIDAGTNAAALRVAAYARHKDEFAHVVVRGPLVVERVAKSQSRRAMKRAEFQASKTAIMEIIAALIGVSPDDLGNQSEAA